MRAVKRPATSIRHASQAPPGAAARATKLRTRSRVAKVRPEKEPKPAPSIPDLWEAFDVVWGFGEPVEAEPASEAKPQGNKGSGKR